MNKDEIEAYDALLAIRYNGEHFRTRIQNMLTKADGTVGRTRRYNSSEFKMFIEDLNPIIEIRPIAYTGNTGNISTRVVIEPNGFTFCIYNKNSNSGRLFLYELLDAYTDYSFNWWSNKIERNVLDDGSYPHWIDDTFADGLITSIGYFVEDIGGHEDMRGDKNCLVCQKAQEYATVMKKLVKDNMELFKSIEQVADNHNEQFVEKTVPLKKDVFVPFSVREERFLTDIASMPKPLSTVWKSLKRTKRSVR